jgi:hypothetical protein
MGICLGGWVDGTWNVPTTLTFAWGGWVDGTWNVPTTLTFARLWLSIFQGIPVTFSWCFFGTTSIDFDGGRKCSLGLVAFERCDIFFPLTPELFDGSDAPPSTVG